MQSAIKIYEIEYHRNGSGGNGFYAIDFSVPADFSPGEVIPHYLGIVFEDDGDVAVVHPGDLQEKFRAEYYEPLLRRVAEEFEEARAPKSEYELYDTSTEVVQERGTFTTKEARDRNNMLRIKDDSMRWIRVSLAGGA